MEIALILKERRLKVFRKDRIPAGNLHVLTVPDELARLLIQKYITTRIYDFSIWATGLRMRSRIGPITILSQRRGHGKSLEYSMRKPSREPISSPTVVRAELRVVGPPPWH